MAAVLCRFIRLRDYRLFLSALGLNSPSAKAEMRSAGVRGLLIYCAYGADPWPDDEAIGSSCPSKRRQRRREDLEEDPGEEEEKQHMLPRYASRPFSIACLILIPESLPRCRVPRWGRRKLKRDE